MKTVVLLLFALLCTLTTVPPELRGLPGTSSSPTRLLTRLTVGLSLATLLCVTLCTLLLPLPVRTLPVLVRPVRVAWQCLEALTTGLSLPHLPPSRMNRPMLVTILGLASPRFALLHPSPRLLRWSKTAPLVTNACPACKDM